MAILDTIPTSAVEEMRKRLMMEGVFNREAELLRLRMDFMDFIDEHARIIWQLRNLTMCLSVEFTVERLREIAKKEGLGDLEGIHQDLWTTHNLMQERSRELSEMIGERANR